MTSTCILLLSSDSSHCITHNANSKAPLTADDVCKKVNQNISKKLDYKSYLHNQYVCFQKMNKLNPPDYNSECTIRKSPPTKQATQSDLDT